MTYYGNIVIKIQIWPTVSKVAAVKVGQHVHLLSISTHIEKIKKGRREIEVLLFGNHTPNKIVCNDPTTEVIPRIRERRHMYSVQFITFSVFINVLLPINVSFMFTVGIVNVVSIDNIIFLKFNRRNIDAQTDAQISG